MPKLEDSPHGALAAGLRPNMATVIRVAQAKLPTPYGCASNVGYRSIDTGAEQIALVFGDVQRAQAPLVRIHSECFTGDIFGSLRCDCGPQLDTALRAIAQDGTGVLVYLRQEGRGIGLLNKIRAYALQEEGLDTIEANEALGFAADSRDYVAGADILRDLGADRVRLLSNNPEKFAALERLGIHVVERIPVLVQPNGHNIAYLRTKQSRMGHLYRVVGDEVALPARPRDLAAAIPA